MKYPPFNQNLSIYVRLCMVFFKTVFQIPKCDKLFEDGIMKPKRILEWRFGVSSRLLEKRIVELRIVPVPKRDMLFEYGIMESKMNYQYIRFQNGHFEDGIVGAKDDTSISDSQMRQAF